MAACSTKNENVAKDVTNENLATHEKNIGTNIEAILQAKQHVKQGDLILRTGRDFTSDVMRRVSLSDKTYSHCGIASFENDTLFVYHAIGGEWNPDQKLRRDRFEFFCNPYENRGFGIFRYSLNEQELAKAFRLVHNFYKQGIMFDMQFDLQTNNRMYCSEFVYKTIEVATNHRIKIAVETLNSREYIAVDDLFINSFCREIKRVKFLEE